jgi:hypothetical protein
MRVVACGLTADFAAVYTSEIVMGWLPAYTMAHTHLPAADLPLESVTLNRHPTAVGSRRILYPLQFVAFGKSSHLQVVASGNSFYVRRFVASGKSFILTKLSPP